MYIGLARSVKPLTLYGVLFVSIVNMKDKNLFGEDIEEYDPKQLSFFNGLGSIVDKENNKSYSFFDYLWNKPKDKED